MGRGWDSPRSWERPDCDRCDNHICPTITSYSSFQLKKALEMVLAKEYEENESSKKQRATAKKQEIAALRHKLMELEKEDE